MGTTLLSELEQAELASRARLLATAAEVDRRVEAARVAASRIEAAAEELVASALAGLRDRHRAQGDLEVAEIEAELGRLEGSAGDADWPVGADAATAAIVAAVLNEPGA